MSNCRTCGAEIIWRRTEANDQLMPLNAEPVDGGNVELLDDGRARVHAAGQTALFDEHPIRYMPHYATCPNWGDNKENHT